MQHVKEYVNVAIHGDQLPKLAFEMLLKPSPVSIVIAVECLIIPKNVNGSKPISTTQNVGFQLS